MALKGDLRQPGPIKGKERTSYHCLILAARVMRLQHRLPHQFRPLPRKMRKIEKFFRA
jgi:hypothetical protein